MGETREQPPKPVAAHSERMLKHFASKQLVGDYKSLAMRMETLARELATELDSQNEAVGDQMVQGFQHMLEALDCFVRAKAAIPN